MNRLLILAALVSAALISACATARPPDGRWIVDPRGGGHVATIGAAVKGARAGDHIVVRPGRYTESLRLTKEVYLEGSGTAAESVLEVKDGLCAMLTGPRGAIRRMTLRTTLPNVPCVQVSKGQWELEDNDISATRKGHAVLAGEEVEKLDVRGNRLHGAEVGLGILSNKGATRPVTVQNNEIFGNLINLLVVGGDPVVTGNRIHDAERFGVGLQEGAKGRFEGNEIYANMDTGLFVVDGSAPVVRKNRIHDGKHAGVFVRKDAKGRYEDNDIYANVTGFGVDTGADPVVVGNRIHDQTNNGVIVREGGKGRFENNDLYGNGSPAFVSIQGSEPVVTGNRIHDGKDMGVLVMDGGKGRFEKNEIAENASVGFYVVKGGDPTVIGNTLTRNLKGNLVRGDGAKGHYTDNTER